MVWDILIYNDISLLYKNHSTSYLCIATSTFGVGLSRHSAWSGEVQILVREKAFYDMFGVTVNERDLNVDPFRANLHVWCLLQTLTVWLHMILVWLPAYPLLHVVFYDQLYFAATTAIRPQVSGSCILGISSNWHTGFCGFCIRGSIKHALFTPVMKQEIRKPQIIRIICLNWP